MDEVVVVKRVPNETEADIVCGLLRSAGIECGTRVTTEIESSLDNFAGDGAHEILVSPADLDAARELLADAPAEGDDSWDDDVSLADGADGSETA